MPNNKFNSKDMVVFTSYVSRIITAPDSIIPNDRKELDKLKAKIANGSDHSIDKTRLNDLAGIYNFYTDYINTYKSTKINKIAWDKAMHIHFFPGSTKFVGTPGGGKQKKATGTGFYTWSNGKEYAIKRAEKFPADDLAELLASKLLRAILREEFAPECSLINRADGAVFLCSEKLNEFQEIYKHKGPSSEVQFDKTKDRIMQNITGVNNREALNIKQQHYKDDFAKILAGCLWVREYDCQTENIAFYKTKDGKNQLVKIDHGWAFSNVFKEKNKSLEPFISKFRIGNRIKPVNHFLDYKDLVNSREMVTQMRIVAKQVDENNADSAKSSSALIASTVDEIITAYKTETKYLGGNEIEQDKHAKEMLQKFAAHMGLQVSYVNNLDNVRKSIVDNLTMKMSDRKISLEVAAAFMEYKLNSKEHGKTFAVKELNGSIEKIKANNRIDNLRNYIPSFAKKEYLEFRIISNSLSSKKSAIISSLNSLDKLSPPFRKSVEFKIRTNT
jgi:hypothetical protein